jgi:DUF2934 family protein
MDVVMDFPVMDKTVVHEAIVRRARELWEHRGRVDGHADEDWAQAEAEVRQQLAQPKVASPAFLAVKANGYVYTCRYDRNSDIYQAGDLAPGEAIRLRIDGNKLYLKVRDRELQTTIVKRAGQ